MPQKPFYDQLLGAGCAQKEPAFSLMLPFPLWLLSRLGGVRRVIATCNTDQYTNICQALRSHSHLERNKPPALHCYAISCPSSRARLKTPCDSLPPTDSCPSVPLYVSVFPPPLKMVFWVPSGGPAQFLGPFDSRRMPTTNSSTLVGIAGPVRCLIACLQLFSISPSHVFSRIDNSDLSAAIQQRHRAGSFRSWASKDVGKSYKVRSGSSRLRIPRTVWFAVPVKHPASFLRLI